MSETDSNPTRFDNLVKDRKSALLFVLTVFAAGVAAGWFGRSLLAGEKLTEQFGLVVAVSALVVSLYAQASEM